MPKPIYNTLDFQNNAAIKIINLTDPTSQQDAATRAYVDNRFGGLNFKEHARAASTGNVNTASPGAAIDGVTLAANDRVLLKDQTTASQNGIYVWNGAAVPMTRSTDADTAAELENAVVSVDEGTVNTLTTWRQTTFNFTLGSGNVVFAAENQTTPAASETVSGKAEIATQGETDAGTDDLRIVTPLKLATSPFRARRAAGTIGDGSATQYDVTHSFGTRDVIVNMYRVASPYDEPIVDIEHLDTNTVRIKFAVAPSSNQFRIVVLG